jgi:hypothetical protein
MLELSLPPPMPHAVGLDQPFNSLSLNPPRSKHDRQQHYSLPLPRNLAPVERWPSGPSEMASSQVGYGLPQPNASAGGVMGQAPHASSQAPPPYSNTLPLPYQASSHRPAVVVSQQHQPLQQQLHPQQHQHQPQPQHQPQQQQQQQQTTYSNPHRRKTSNHAVAPSLQVPKSVNAPQLSVPQLAAEVCHSGRANSTW